jgi:ribonuclease VapC
MTKTVCRDDRCRYVGIDGDSRRRTRGSRLLEGAPVCKGCSDFGDCFAYDVAKQNACPLLFVGNDFSRTDIESAL